MSLKEIAEISREYGTDTRYVIAGGGNTSFKDDKHLYVKASGHALATIEEDGFVKMERALLQQIWTREYPADAEKREAVALADLMAARSKDQADKRPSVESLLHEAFPQTFVVHTHPALVNGITCSREGKTAADRLFGNRALWIPLVNPGYVLAVTIKGALEKHLAEFGQHPEYILLQNHGVFIASDTIGGIKSRYASLFTTITDNLEKGPDDAASAVNATDVKTAVELIREAFNRTGGAVGDDLEIRFSSSMELLNLSADASTFAPVSSSYTPDHIVYCGHKALFVESGGMTPSAFLPLVEGFLRSEGVLPKTIVVSGVGVFGCGRTGKGAENAVQLFNDAVRVAVYAESFGGYQFMTPDQIAFIRGWEVENYRSEVSTQK